MTIPKASYCCRGSNVQIKDIFKLQVRLMRNFLDYVAVTLERDDKALFLLNRFHLSTYTVLTGITEQA